MTPSRGPDPERLFSIFLDLARIDSESGNEGRVAGYIRNFCSDLGLGCIEDRAGTATGGQSGNLVVKVPAGGGFPNAPPIILNAHMDTVMPGEGVSPISEGGRFKSDGRTVLGADDKAGIAAILCTVEYLIGTDEERRALELVFTVQEESGLLGVKNIDRSIIEGRRGIVLDGAGQIGGIVLEAPTRDDVRFTIHGSSAHAGVEPEKGINAIGCAAEAIAGLRLGRLDEGTTMNIGVISGGRAANIVPDRVVVEGEVRGLSDERVEAEREAMIEGFREAASDRGCEVEVEAVRSFERFKIEEGSPMVRMLCRAMEECGVRPRFLKSGGGSDANVFNREGLEVVTMSAGFENSHSQEEYILKDDLIVLAGILTRLATLRFDGEDGSS